MYKIGIIEILFLISLFLFIYPFLIYPLILKLISILYKTPVEPDDNYEPEVSIVISVYNEEKYIENAINSLLELDYPQDKIMIYIGSDGSTDRTNEIIQNYSAQYKNIQVQIFERMGKHSVLNNLMKGINSELVFFMDADCRPKFNALKKLVYKLSDEKIGAAIAFIHPIDEFENVNAARYGDSIYQKYENYLKITESDINTTVGSAGQFYGIKYKYYHIIPNDNVWDDYFPLLYIMTKKKRVVICKDAIVYEVRNKNLKDEYRRRIRIAAGSFSTIWELKQLFLPKYPWACFTLLSHRILRFWAPFFLIGVVILGLILDTSTILYYPAKVGIILFVITSILGFILEKYNKNINIFKIPTLVITICTAFVLGFLRFLLKKPNSKWTHKNI